MDEITVIEVWTAASLGGLGAAALVYLHRFGAGTPARLWSWAWLAFFASLIFTIPQAWPARLVAHAAGTAFPTLLLAGSLAFANRGVPTWLIPAGVAIGFVRGVSRIIGYESVAEILTIGVEAPADWVAAYLLIQIFRSRKGSPAILACAALLAVFGIMEISNVALVGRGKQPPLAYFALGSSSALMLALTQGLVLMERAHRRHVEDLNLLRQVAQAGSAELDATAVAGHTLDALQQRLPAHFGGVWVLDRGEGRLRCVKAVGSPMPRISDVSISAPDQKLTRQILRDGEPLFFNDIPVEETSMHPWLSRQGFGSAAMIPLREPGHTIGFMLVARSERQPFDPAERNLLTTLSHELTLALQHVKTVERLANERQTLSSVIHAAPVGILVTDRSSRITLINHTLAEHLGESDGRAWLDYGVGELSAAISERFREPAAFVEAFSEPAQSVAASPHVMIAGDQPNRELMIFSNPIASKERSWGASDRSEPIGRVWVTNDVSEQRRLEHQLRQTHKMETIGTFAGGIAHDFNNQLAVILGNAGLLRRSPDVSSEEEAALVDLERAADHCADLTRALLSFARRVPLEKSAVPVQKTANDVEALLGSVLPSTIDFRVDNECPDASVEADPTQLQQILINLVINGRDAIEGTGFIRLAIRERRVRAGEPADSRNVRPGRFVEFAVEDDGCGMDRATQERIFEPFFTTKAPGDGTGLGLAVVYGAARAQDGWIEVDSVPGKGSTFRVLLPVASSDVHVDTKPSQTLVACGEETVLLADDEPGIRRILRFALTGAGFRVIEAVDGKEAVETFEKQSDSIDLVILDVTMPHLSGTDALSRIRSVAPTIPAILCSGMGVDVEPCFGDHTGVLSKPFSCDNALQLVRELLDTA